MSAGIALLRKADNWHGRLIARIVARETLAFEATTGEHWHAGQFSGSVTGGGRGVIDLNQCVATDGGDPIAFTLIGATAEFIADNDPARTLRRASALASVADRHKPEHREQGFPACEHCATPYPCADLRDIAAGEGLAWP